MTTEHDFIGITTSDERKDELFRERVAICLADGECGLIDAVMCARAERRARIKREKEKQ